MSASAASRLFLNYTKIEPKIPGAIWVALRIATFAITCAIVYVLARWPALGLKLFWGVAIPVVPALLVVAPGLWRQICPMAFLNQIPRALGFTLGRDLPETLRASAFSIAVLIFFVAVALRVPVLNHEALVLAGGLALVLALAFAGGLVFKGRSGWCGTFCPLGPIQRDYGHAPLVMVRNGYCTPCVGCQKNCYDFNPRAAIFGDMQDDDPRYAGQRRFFMGMMPGMILGYFLQGPTPVYGEPLHALILLGATCASVGFYQATISFVGLDPFRAANLFAALAVAVFYIFGGPIMVTTVSGLLDVAPPAAIALASQTIGLMLAAAMIFQGWRNGRIFRDAANASDHVRVDESRRTLVDRLGGKAPQATEMRSGVTFPVSANQTLLEAMETAKVKINFGCRSGMCGADPVAVREGADNLSPPGEEELATLRRLGLEGKARLACMCQVNGPVVVDVDVNATASAPVASAAPAADPAEASGLRKVVIVGNGVAGLGVAEALRRASPSVEISVVTDEPHHFYNRMAIGRVIYGRTSMDGLYLLPDGWYAEKRIEVWRNTIASSIDRAAKIVRLGTGETLPYDRLVLATGARAASPGKGYDGRPNAFVLRTSADAQAIRARIQTHGARKAVVIGGGVLGVEAADALHHLGLDVVLLQRSGRLMDRQLDHEGAHMLTNYLENVGIGVRADAVVEAFGGDGDLQSLRLADGEIIHGDIFIASVGAVANAGIAKACGIEVGRGIKVDPFMRTSDPDVFAVGDVVELPGAVGGLWPVGAAQAETAAAAMLGKPAPYAPPRLLLQLKCDGVDLRSYGDPEPRADDETFTARDDEGLWWRLVVRGGQLVGAVFVGPPGSARDFTRLVKEGADLDRLRTALESARRSESLEPA